ncbi:hypothetical protein J0S82_000695, partial [Galemys pyrenaicus]
GTAIIQLALKFPTQRERREAPLTCYLCHLEKMEISFAHIYSQDYHLKYVGRNDERKKEAKEKGTWPQLKHEPVCAPEALCKNQQKEPKQL